MSHGWNYTHNTSHDAEPVYPISNKPRVFAEKNWQVDLYTTEALQLTSIRDRVWFPQWWALDFVCILVRQRSNIYKHLTELSKLGWLAWVTCTLV